MIVVRVELHSAVNGSVTELARMHIANIGGTRNLGEYDAVTFRGRDTETLNKSIAQKCVRLEKYPRLRLHVWNLVTRALNGMGYK